MSTALMTKYLEATRAVVNHLLLTPRGIRFAPHPVVTDTDRDKYCVKRIVAFYQRQPTDLADYFFAAWVYQHRKELQQPGATLDDVAHEHDVSPKYLATIWGALTVESIDIGPLARIQQMWRELPDEPARTPADLSQVRAACERIRDYVVQVRKQFTPTFDNLFVEGVHKGTQAFVLWKNKQYARHRRSTDFGCFQREQETTDEDQIGENTRQDDPGDRWLIPPPRAEDRDRMLAACEQFCSIFPDAFYISERGRGYLGKSIDEQEKGRLLSAGFHSMMGYFRDDQPLYEMILDSSDRKELDDLWQELDFITAAPQRQYQGFLWFDRTDSRFMRDPRFDFARPEDLEALSEPMIARLAKVYLEKATDNGAADVPRAAIVDYFREINAQIRWVQQARIAAQGPHLEAVISLAQRAYRRPLTAVDEQQIRAFYHERRSEDELSHPQAIQDTIVSILMSPRFCYRLDLLSNRDQTGPLDDHDLASRLSYFLWSSMPDAELLRHAAAGDLHQQEVLLQQTRRMLADDRVAGLATEFGANWLDFRRFEEHNAVDRDRFPNFDDQLRRAMFEEPIRFMVDLLQHDRSMLDFLYSDRTFVNAALANHYGMHDLFPPDGPLPEAPLAKDPWLEVSGAGQYGRGGLLPMAVFLTKNSPGLRTSPVKRGHWVVRRLLGEHIPPPPPDVPELPSDESKLGELTLPEMLAKHRDHASCAGCHDRFDAIGLVFEGFGPTGQRRTKDLGGRAVDTTALFPDGSRRDGVAQLRRYLQQRREDEFVGNLCRKLLSYALGRTLLLSDEVLLENMRSDSPDDGRRFSKLVEAIINSPQFLNKRGRDMDD